MTAQQRLALRVAQRIADQWATPVPPEPVWPRPEWQACSRLIGQIETANRKGWSLAARKLKSRLATTLASLQSQLNTYAQPADVAHAAPTLHMLYEEILGLESEFGGFRCDLPAGTLAVETEALRLEDCDLGPFEIRLEWSRLRQHPVCRVIALDPQPATGHPAVTHPHVQAEQLCEGEGRAALRSALADGRLSDFFTIVAQILRTYNASSAYVALASWHGADCDDCGDRTPEDEQGQCTTCERRLCGACEVCCGDCGRGQCESCTDRCDDCEERLCGSCRRSCDHCGENCCPTCLEDGLCHACQSEVHEEETCHAATPETEAETRTQAASPCPAV